MPSAGDARVTWLVARPTELLLPNTIYEAQLLLSPAGEACGCEESQWTTVTTFGTAGEVDEVAPSYAGVPALVYGDPAHEAGPCGDINHVPAWPGVENEVLSEWAYAYNVYVDGRLEKPYVRSLSGTPAVAELLVDCGSTQLHPASRLAAGKTFEVRAVDLAGNESSPNQPILVDDVCPAARPVARSRRPCCCSPGGVAAQGVDRAMPPPVALRAPTSPRSAARRAARLRGRWGRSPDCQRAAQPAESQSMLRKICSSFAPRAGATAVTQATRPRRWERKSAWPSRFWFATP